MNFLSPFYETEFGPLEDIYAEVERILCRAVR